MSVLADNFNTNPLWNYVQSQEVAIPNTPVSSGINVNGLISQIKENELNKQMQAKSDELYGMYKDYLQKAADSLNTQGNGLTPNTTQQVNIPNVTTTNPINNHIDNIWNFIKKWEGGYTANPASGEGAVNYGINLRYNRNSIPDYNGDGVIDANDVKALTSNDARKIWENKYYNPSGASRLNNPGMQLFYSDTYFNQGPAGAKSIFNNALNKLGLQSTGDIIADINKAPDQYALLDIASKFRDDRYKGSKYADLYYNGWNNRRLDAYANAKKYMDLFYGR